MTVTLPVLLIAMAAQTALWLAVFWLFQNRPSPAVEALRFEVRKDIADLRRYVDESVSSAIVESHARDVEMRRQIEDAFAHLLRAHEDALVKRVEKATYDAVNRVAEERAEVKAQNDAASARDLLTRMPQKPRKGEEG
jgi:hypothetical protein